jgi:hypothetical protein
MAADPTITAALRAAAEAARIAGCQPGCCGEGTGCEVGPCHCARVAATAAIAAFLRALPDVVRSVPFKSNSDGMLHTRQSYFAGDLAAAVEAASDAA